jgi:hypothetical protein
MKYFGIVLLIVMLTVVYLSVDDNWNSFQPYNRLDTKNIAVENTLKKLLMQTKLKAKDEANAIIAAENVKNLQQQKLKFGVTSSKLLGLPYEDASAQLSTKSTIVASEDVLMGDDKIKKISQGKIAVLQYDGKVNTINVSGS